MPAALGANEPVGVDVRHYVVADLRLARGNRVVVDVGNMRGKLVNLLL